MDRTLDSEWANVFVHSVKLNKIEAEVRSFGDTWVEFATVNDDNRVYTIVEDDEHGWVVAMGSLGLSVGEGYGTFVEERTAEEGQEDHPEGKEGPHNDITEKPRKEREGGKESSTSSASEARRKTFQNAVRDHIYSGKREARSEDFQKLADVSLSLVCRVFIECLSILYYYALFLLLSIILSCLPKHRLLCG